MGNFITVQEAAATLRLKPVTIYRMIHKKQLPATKIGGAVRIPVEALMEVIKQRTSVVQI